MKVMYFLFDGFDTQNGSNHLIIKMIDEFLKEGMEVYLVTSHTKGIYQDIPELLQNRQGFTYDIINRSDVSKTNFVHRYLDGVKYSFKSMKAWKRQISKVDAIILQSTPTAFFSSVLLTIFGSKPIIFNSYDVFPNGAYDMGAIKSKLVFKILQSMQKRVYKNSDKIVVISRDMKNQLCKIGVPNKKIVEIKNWYDDESIKTIHYKENRFSKKYNIPPNGFYVQYAGNFGYTFNYKMVLDVAELLKDYHGITFQMIGDGGLRDIFVQEAERRGLDNIIFYPWQPLDIISDVYSTCSIQFIPLSKGVIWNSFPSKGSLIMACGRVVLCSTETESQYYKELNENDVGICVTNSSPNESAEAILNLFKDRERLKEIGENAKEYAAKVYSSTSNIDKFVNLLNEYRSN